MSRKFLPQRNEIHRPHFFIRCCRCAFHSHCVWSAARPRFGVRDLRPLRQSAATARQTSLQPTWSSSTSRWTRGGAELSYPEDHALSCHRSSSPSPQNAGAARVNPALRRLVGFLAASDSEWKTTSGVDSQTLFLANRSPFLLHSIASEKRGWSMIRKSMPRATTDGGYRFPKRSCSIQGDEMTISEENRLSRSRSFLSRCKTVTFRMPAGCPRVAAQTTVPRIPGEGKLNVIVGTMLLSIPIIACSGVSAAVLAAWGPF